MNYQLTTYQGVKITMDNNFDFYKYLAGLNDREINSVAIGNVSTLKNNIRTIYPMYEEGETREGEKITIITNSRNEAMTAYATNYDSAKISEQYNNRSNTFIVIGDTAIHRNEYSLVMKDTELQA